MKIFSRRLIFSLLSLATLTPSTLPAESKRAMPDQYFRVLMDNDVIFDEDNDYTNGVRFDYTRALDADSYWGLSLTQNMYTPFTNAEYVPEGEHPYCGHLALGVGYITVGEKWGTSTEFQLGVTGDPSFARETQRIIHGIGNLFQWRGWDQQIPTEITFQLSSRQDFDIDMFSFKTANGWESDSMIFTRQEVGTVNIRAGAGYVFRFGKNLPPVYRNLGNRSANYGVSSLSKSDYDPSKISYFFVASAYGEYVAHDLSIDGGVFRDFDSTASRQPWQSELQFGLGLIYKEITYFAGFTYHSKQFRTQEREQLYKADTNLYGTISVGWSF